jgi:hypothetical protein
MASRLGEVLSDNSELDAAIDPGKAAQQHFSLLYTEISEFMIVS